MQTKNNIGLGTAAEITDPKTIRYINLKLALLGFPTVTASSDPEFDEMAAGLLQHQHEVDRLLADHLCPTDRSGIQVFLNDYLKETNLSVKLLTDVCSGSIRPGPRAFIAGGSRRVCLGTRPHGIASSRACCTICRPTAARRREFFYIAEGGLGIPDDKRARAESGVWLSCCESGAWRGCHQSYCDCRSLHWRQIRRHALFHSCCGRWWSRKFPDTSRRKRWRSVSSRRETW